MNYKHIIVFFELYNYESTIKVKIFNSLSFHKNYMRNFFIYFELQTKLKYSYTKNSNIKLIVKIFQ